MMLLLLMMMMMMNDFNCIMDAVYMTNIQSISFIPLRSARHNTHTAVARLGGQHVAVGRAAASRGVRQ